MNVWIVRKKVVVVERWALLEVRLYVLVCTEQEIKINSYYILSGTVLLLAFLGSGNIFLILPQLLYSLQLLKF